MPLADAVGKPLNADALLEAAQRYGGDEVLVGRDEGATGDGALQWSLYRAGSSENWTGPLAAGIDHTVEQLVPAPAATASQAESDTRVRIEGRAHAHRLRHGYAAAAGDARGQARQHRGRGRCQRQFRCHRARRRCRTASRRSPARRTLRTAAAPAQSPCSAISPEGCAPARPSPRMRHLPNLICLLRIALIWPILAALHAGRYLTALALFVARRGLRRSRRLSCQALRLDLASSGAFWIRWPTSCCSSWCSSRARGSASSPGGSPRPSWRAMSLIGLGALTFRLWFGPLHGRPTVVSKINTAAQLLYVALVLLNAAAGVPPREVLDACALITLRDHGDLRLATTSAPSRGARGARRRAPEASPDATDSPGCAPAGPRRVRKLPAGAQRARRSSMRAASPPGEVGRTHLAVRPARGRARRTCCRRSARRRASASAPATFRWASSPRLGVGVLEGLPQLDCLCMDDIDRGRGQLEWERALFALLRELEDAGGRLVLAASAPPALLQLGAAGPRLALRGAAPYCSCACSTRPSSGRRSSCARGCAASSCRMRRCSGCSGAFRATWRSLYELLDTLDEAALVAQRRLTIPFIREVLSSAARRGH